MHDLCDVHVLGRHISARRDGNTTQMSNVQRLIKSLFSVIQNSSERWILFSCRLGSLSFLQLYHPELPYIPREGCVKVTIPVGRKGYTEIKQFSKTTSYTHIPFLVCVCVCVYVQSCLNHIKLRCNMSAGILSASGTAAHKYMQGTLFRFSGSFIHFVL